MNNPIKTLGPVTAIIGAQWGDEGKGKIIDILSETYDITARSAGGANAGHTVIVNGKKYALHLLPCGCLHKGTELVLGSGMVIHLPTLLEEIKTIQNDDFDPLSHLHIAQNAHVVLEYHKEIDAVLEDRRGGSGIGTTKRGIGPTYAEKAYRTGLRMQDVATRSETELREILNARAKDVQEMFCIKVDVENELKNLMEAKNIIGSHVKNTILYLHAELKKGKTLLIEGAQATQLDIDHGTYPYVTSSSTTVMGALQGLGLPPKTLTAAIGVVKAYCTRVGGGPFQTEVLGERGDALRERGAEYGATTGRPRRCGWLSLSDLQHGVILNGFTHLNVTKLDVLDSEETIPVYDGDEVTELPGWKSSTSGMASFDNLPENAQKYIKYIEEKIDIPVAFIGTGPEREEMIMR